MHVQKLSFGRWGMAFAAAMTGWLVAAPAFAEDAAAKASAPAAESSAVGDSDHERFVGSFAVGYMGASLVPIATNATLSQLQGNVNTMTAEAATVYAPVIGVRYWLNSGMGIDVGIGFRNFSGSITRHVADFTTATQQAPAPVEKDYAVDKVNQMGFLLHAGVPIALATEKHYVFEVIPEANVGFSSGTIKEQPYTAASSTVAPTTLSDINLSGFRLDVGARVGSEIHFGFIGIPQLALQATVGAYFSYEKFKADGGSHPPNNPPDPAGALPNTSYSSSSSTISTSVNNDPWAIFTNNVSALYYF